MKKLLETIFRRTFRPQLSNTQIRLGRDTTVVFATIDEGKQILVTQDEFVRRMSPFDRAARMKTDKDISEKEYLEFVGKNVLGWSDAEKQKIASAFYDIQQSIESLSLSFPKEILMVKTTGKEEGQAPYTRTNAIIIPERVIRLSNAKIKKIISHELFHIMSRVNPDLREKLYASIGFAKCDEVVFPLELKSRKITNPDAPKNDHCIYLQVSGKERCAIPILFSCVEKYDINRGGEFFNYLQFQFLLVEKNESSPTIKYDGQTPSLVGVEQVSGFFEQVGNNTEYIIHPEEILADNFTFLVLQKSNLPTPAIIKKLETILKETGSSLFQVGNSKSSLPAIR